jgi:methyl-accepting chemotaxis protein
LTRILVVCANVFAALALALLVARTCPSIASMVAAGASFAACALLLVSFYRRMLRPLAQLGILIAELNDKAVVPLAAGLVEITKGNLGTRVASERMSAPPGIRGDLGLVVKSYEEVYASLSRGILAFNAVTHVPCRRLCFTGADDYRSGELAARLLGAKLQGGGTAAMIAVDNATNYSTLREQGFLNALSRDFPGIKVVHTVLTERSAARAEEGVRSLLQRFPDLDGLYQLEEATTLTTLELLAKLRKPGTMTLICHGKREEFLDYFKKGFITASITQAPYLQGYNPLVHAYNHLVAGWQPLASKFFITPGVVTPENCRDAISVATETEGIALPADVMPPRRLAFAYLIPKKTDFWPPVWKGAEDARRLLSGKNVELTILQPCHEGNYYDTERWIRLIEELIERGIHALAVPVFSNALVPVLNTAVQRGTVVVTYNQEPSSLRELISSISEQAASVLQSSHVLSSGARESSQVTGQIRDSLIDMQKGIAEQTTSIKATDGTFQSLLDMIEGADREADAMARMAHLILEEVEKSGNSVRESKRAANDVKDSAERTRSLMQELSESSKEIGSIAAFIEEITSRTNLLAVNASIQAARAGKDGKGFSVVSTEIRNLAGLSAQAAVRITGIIRAIQSSISQAFQRSETEMAQVLKSTAQAAIAEESLRHIDDSARANVTATESVLFLLRRMTEDSRRARELLRDLTRINASTTAANQLISASAEQMAAGAASVHDTAQRLAEMAKAQETLLSTFRFENSQTVSDRVTSKMPP